MSLPPPQFQIDAPAPLGAKVVAITQAPAPHVHQWVPVPDSKIHSRCAECGTVTLTEIVAPKVTFKPFTFIPNEGLTELMKALESHLVGTAHRARPLLDTQPFGTPTRKIIGFHKGMLDVPIVSAISGDARHYQSITDPDGKVRMVETDAEGWVTYAGGQPVADSTEVEIRFPDGSEGQFCASYAFRNIGLGVTHWRMAK